MGLDLPDLDDQRYADLRETAESLLEAHADAWTDHGAADPGITVLELLAWLTETYGYQLDRVTDDHRRKFLGLLGDRPRPPESATATLSVEDADGRIPLGTPVTAHENGETHRFETTRAVVPSGATVERVVVDGSAGRVDVTGVNERADGRFRVFGDAPEAGDALHLGFDTDPFADGERLTLSVDYHEASLPAPTPGSFEPSVALAWEQFADGEWRPLATHFDGTNALYEGGTITLAEGSDPDSGGVGTSDAVDRTADPPTTDGHWLRCRVVRPGYEFPPAVSAVRADRVPVEHRRSVGEERLCPAERGSNGALDGQRYAFEHTPVRSATVSVDGEPWTEVGDLDPAGPDDRVYVLDRTAGTVEFGDGHSGAVPPATATVTATYTAGGGAAANVSPAARWAIDLESATVSADGGATGGRDGETIEAALERAERSTHVPQRAVTAADYRSVVARTPGTRIERVNAVVTEGETRVVVVPYAPSDVARPRPSEGLLDAVREHLGERTLLGERVSVCGPEYVTVDVTVDGERAAGAEQGRVARALSEFLHPVAGSGWAFGRPLTPASVRDRLASCEAVAAVEAVTLSPRRGGADGAVETGGRRLLALGDVTWRGRG